MDYNFRKQMKDLLKDGKLEMIIIGFLLICFAAHSFALPLIHIGAEVGVAYCFLAIIDRSLQKLLLGLGIFSLLFFLAAFCMWSGLEEFMRTLGT